MTNYHFHQQLWSCALEPDVEHPPGPPPTACTPSCGANAECKVVGNRGTCTCLTGFLGRPELGCKPECITSLDCSYDRACVNQRCIDPCVGSCGLGAQCQVSNHNPICSCPKGMVGDPFRICQPSTPGMLHAF